MQLKVGMFVHVCNAPGAVQSGWFSTTREKRVEKVNVDVFYSKTKIFLCDPVQTVQPNPYTLKEKGIFSSFPVRNFFSCGSLQNSWSTDQQPLTKFTFYSYCLVAFTSPSNMRTFCAHFILSDECFKHNKVMVSWDLFAVFLTAAELYSPSTWTYTPAGNNQQKVEGPLEMRQSYMHFLKEWSGDLPPCISSLPDWLLHSINPFFVHFSARDFIHLFF